VSRLPTFVRDLLPVAFLVALLGAVYALPPDRSFADVRDAGVLKACVPPLYPPLVTADAGAPGIDIDLVKAIAAELGVAPEFNQNAAIGRDFNPRAWRLTRVQCALLAGAVVDSPTTRSFLDAPSTERSARCGGACPPRRTASAGSIWAR